MLDPTVVFGPVLVRLLDLLSFLLEVISLLLLTGKSGLFHISDWLSLIVVEMIEVPEARVGTPLPACDEFRRERAVVSELLVILVFLKSLLLVKPGVFILGVLEQSLTRGVTLLRLLFATE